MSARFGRRPFLWILASSVLAACAPPRNDAPENATQTSAPASDDVARFLAFSAILTGYSDLDANLAGTYLNDLRANAARGATLDAIFKAAGFGSETPPKTLADLQKSGVLTDAAQLSVASQVLQTWYSGISNAATGQTTVTWTQALAWRACRFTKPPSTCGGPGSWAKAPQA